MKRPFSLYAAALLLFLSSPPALAVHNFEGQCETCHLTNPGSANLLFTDEIETLCRNCHQLQQNNVHPTNAVPTMAMPEGFWLDANGRLNCATCHDPHQAAAEEQPHLLRSATASTDFCLLCHTEAVTAKKRHVAAVFHAHSKSTPSSTISGGQLDDLSIACVSCHDGSGGQMIMFCVLGQEEQCSSHVLGVDYQKAAAADARLHPPSELSPLISLYQGKVGCLSCHNIYSVQAAQLVISNAESRLCRECHRF